MMAIFPWARVGISSLARRRRYRELPSRAKSQDDDVVRRPRIEPVEVRGAKGTR